MANNTSFNELTVLAVKKETEETVSIKLEVPEHLKEMFQYKAGQYLTFKQQINGEEVRRSYSICSAAYENELCVAVKKVVQGKFSTYANEELKAGDVLETMPPMGKFILNNEGKDDSKTYVFLQQAVELPQPSLL